MKDPRAEDLEDGISLYHTKKEDPTAFKNSLDFVSSTAPAIKKTMSIRASAVQAKKEGRHQFPVDGKLFGMGTNIWSVYEDHSQGANKEQRVSPLFVAGCATPYSSLAAGSSSQGANKGQPLIRRWLLAAAARGRIRGSPLFVAGCWQQQPGGE